MLSSDIITYLVFTCVIIRYHLPCFHLCYHHILSLTLFSLVLSSDIITYLFSLVLSSDIITYHVFTCVIIRYFHLPCFYLCYHQISLTLFSLVLSSDITYHVFTCVIIRYHLPCFHLCYHQILSLTLFSLVLSSDIIYLVFTCVIIRYHLPCFHLCYHQILSLNLFSQNYRTVSIVKPTSCTISQIYFILEQHYTCFGQSFCPSSGVWDSTYSIRYMSHRFCGCLLASSHRICMVWCSMYILRLLMMDGKTIRNMYSVVPIQNKFEILCIWLVLL